MSLSTDIEEKNYLSFAVWGNKQLKQPHSGAKESVSLSEYRNTLEDPPAVKRGIISVHQNVITKASLPQDISFHLRKENYFESSNNDAFSKAQN